MVVSYVMKTITNCLLFYISIRKDEKTWQEKI